MLESHIGEVLEGVVTGITTFGIFIESSKYLVEGLVRLQDLGDDWWEANPKGGVVVAQRTGRQIRLGDALTVRIFGVDLGRRQLDFRIEKFPARRLPAGKQDQVGQAPKKRKAKEAKPAPTLPPPSGGGKQPGGKPAKRRRRRGKR
jgi:ribonuclease R